VKRAAGGSSQATPEQIAQFERLAVMAEAAQVRRAAKILNEHHNRTCAGFYCPRGRFFQARVTDGRLELHDWEIWTIVPNGMVFHDHNGREIAVWGSK